MNGAGGKAYCWGHNLSGQLGDGSADSHSLVPRELGGDRWYWVEAGGYHTCGRYDAWIYCWGQNTYGQLGDGTHSHQRSPFYIWTGDSRVWPVSLSAGLSRSCGMMPDAFGVLKLMCWGRNLSGQLGDGTLTERSTPTLVREPANP